MMIVKDLFNKLTNALIINISSVSDRIPDAEFSLYCSSKAASTRYFEAVAKELPNSRTFNFLPTYVDTPLLKTIHKDDGFDFDPILKTNDIVRLIQKIEDGQLDIESGSNIIVVNSNFLEDLENYEKLYSYIADTEKLTKIS